MHHSPTKLSTWSSSTRWVESLKVFNQPSLPTLKSLASTSIFIFLVNIFNMTFIITANVTQVNFWYQEYFHGVNLSSLRDSAMCEYFRQPIVSLKPHICFVLSGSFYFFSSQVDTFDINICTAKTQRHVIDFQVLKTLNFVFEDLQSKPFQTAHETDLHRIEIPLEFHMLSSGRGQLFNSIGGWLILND